MSNLTLAIDDALLREARIKALQDGTSVNEICRKAIEQYVGRNFGSEGERRAAMLRATFALAKHREPGDGPAWEGREAIYAERMDELGRRRRK
jgi:hypothetical protein